jgi:hypothetical protein
VHKVTSLLWKGPKYTIEASSLRMNGDFVIKADNSLLKCEKYSAYSMCRYVHVYICMLIHKVHLLYMVYF